MAIVKLDSIRVVRCMPGGCKTGGRGPNRLRIIGGQWRGRILSFPDAMGLRPTPDRVRETLFNWLQGAITGARCLDLFAGSGALGIEALSRGAAEAILVEHNPLVARVLREHLGRLRTEQGQVIQIDAGDYLQGIPQAFNLIFLDPPFYHGWLARCFDLLGRHGWLAPQAWIYLETEVGLSPLLLPPDWELIHSQRAGQVGYHLAHYQAK